MRYEHFISYEEFKTYFDGKDDVISKVRSQQLVQAIERAKKPAETIVNEAATYSSISTKPIRNSITLNWIYAPARSPMAGGHTFLPGSGTRTSITSVLKVL